MIEPIAYHGPLNGKSKSHLMRLSDGQDYVVKFVRREHEKVLPNEWLGYCLARFLGLPVPYSQIIHVPEPFFRKVQDTEDIVHTPTEFATLYVPKSMILRQFSGTRNEKPGIVNAETLAGIIVLDYWLYNRDRNRNNVLLSEEGPNSYRLWMIDQGDLLGSSSWSLEQAKQPALKLFPSAAHKWLANFIDSERAFDPYLEIVQTIPTLLIREILEMVPTDWHLSDAERDAVVQWMVFRRDKQLRPLIHRFIKSVYRVQRTR